MKHLELTIKSNKPKAISFSVTENWSELNHSQLLYISAHWQAWQMLIKHKQPLQYAKAKLFVFLIVGKTAQEIKEITQLLSQADFEELDLNLLSLTNFIFEKIDFTKNIFPSVKISWFKKLYGPADKLANISIIEFSYALNYYNLYNKTANESNLDLLIACLYRPLKSTKSNDGDERIYFNVYTADSYLKQISKLKYVEKQAIYLFFHGCIELFGRTFDYIFTRSSGEGTASNKTFLDIILELSGGKFGTYNETKTENALIVLKALNMELEKNSKEKP